MSQSETVKNFFLTPKPRVSLKSTTVFIVLLFISAATAPQQSQLSAYIITAAIFYFLFIPLPQTKANCKHTVYCGFLYYLYMAVRFHNRCDSEEILKYRNQAVQKIVSKSKNSMNIQATTGNPVVIVSPEFRKQPGLSEDNILRRYDPGKEIYIYSTYEVTVFHFTESYLGVFRTHHSLLKDINVGDETFEIFYQDVSAVRTKSNSSSYILKDGETLEHAKIFSLAINNGQEIIAVINDPKIKSDSEIVSIGDDAINNIRAMLRDYKNIN